MSHSTQQGFTLIEWLIAIVIGLFLTAGIGSFLVASQRTTEATYHSEQMMDSGRIATHLITRDLKMVGFFGEYTGKPMVRGAGVTLVTSDIPSANDCLTDWVGATPEGSFPSAGGRFSPLFVGQVSNSNSLSGQYACVSSRSNLVLDSDVIGIKRVIGSPKLSAADLNSKRYYFAANSAQAELFTSSDPWPSEADMPGRQVWEYQHFVYYLDVSAQSGLPVLRKLYLHNDSGMQAINGPLVEGIERMRLLLGVDTDTSVDGVINEFIAASNVTPLQWSEGRVIGAKLYLLVRSLTEDQNYTNNNSYELGDVAVAAANDHYRRTLFESVIFFRNMVY
ncbi:PilW family protein [Agarivorans sp. QJM3NY_33]|uniref:PilW family protein n=1 Tax=Agarivorans sp. QJM3NY_33 TaxID=3421432 RepID=UPI003D7DF16E